MEPGKVTAAGMAYKSDGQFWIHHRAVLQLGGGVAPSGDRFGPLHLHLYAECAPEELAIAADRCEEIGLDGAANFLRYLTAIESHVEPLSVPVGYDHQQKQSLRVNRWRKFTAATAPPPPARDPS